MDKGFTLPVLNHGFVRLIDWLGSDLRIAESARISYQSPSKGEEADKKLINYLYKNQHTSPFEQCKITFNIKLPLFVAGQYNRHRMQNLNYISFRYTEAKEEFYIPRQIDWRRQDTKNKQGSLPDPLFLPMLEGGTDIKDGVYYVQTSNVVYNFCKDALTLYKKLLEVGISREMSRMILPQNLYTECYSTWDLHNLMHFLTLRLDPHAQWEIQEYAKAMEQITQELFPWTFEAYHKYYWELKEHEEKEL
jgi:thymidylate synthase (FAD)